jgi:hypothetical protein
MKRGYPYRRSYTKFFLDFLRTPNTGLKLYKEAYMKMKRNLTIVSIIAILIFAASIGYMKGVLDGQTGQDMSLVATAEAKKQENVS